MHRCSFLGASRATWGGGGEKCEGGKVKGGVSVVCVRWRVDECRGDVHAWRSREGIQGKVWVCVLNGARTRGPPTLMLVGRVWMRDDGNIGMDMSRDGGDGATSGCPEVP